MERAIQTFAVIHFAVIGISHIVQPRVWAEFFIALRAQGKRGVFAIAFLTLWFGTIIVAFHNVWSGIPIVLTLVGWAQVVKGTIYFLFPGFGLKQMQRVSVERSWYFVPGGAVFIVLAGLLVFHLVRASGSTAG
jgi:hypothetical protein